MTIDILIFQPRQRDRDNRRARFHSEERGPMLTFFQSPRDRLSPFRSQTNHPSFCHSTQRSSDCFTIRLSTMYPDDPISPEDRSNQPVIIQLDLAYAFNRREGKSRKEQNSIRIPQVIESDNSWSTFGKIFQSADLGAQGHKDQ